MLLKLNDNIYYTKLGTILAVASKVSIYIYNSRLHTVCRVTKLNNQTIKTIINGQIDQSLMWNAWFEKYSIVHCWTGSFSFLNVKS